MLIHFLPKSWDRNTTDYLLSFKGAGGYFSKFDRDSCFPPASSLYARLSYPSSRSSFIFNLHNGVSLLTLLLARKQTSVFAIMLNYYFSYKNIKPRCRYVWSTATGPYFSLSSACPPFCSAHRLHIVSRNIVATPQHCTMPCKHCRRTIKQSIGLMTPIATQ